MSASSPSQIISLKKVKFLYRGRSILDLPNFDLNSDETCVLMGPNGAGKTTFLRVLLGLQKITQGSITLLGKELQNISRGQLSKLRQQIGYIPQIASLSYEFPLTVREAVSTGKTASIGCLRTLSSSDYDSINFWMKQLGIIHLADRRIDEISGGECRKLLIARAMVQEPALLLMDEPTANLDMGWREQILTIIQELYQKTRKALILVCHELEVIPPCCRRVLLLNKGKIESDTPIQKAFTPENIQKLYHCRMQILQKNDRFFTIPEFSQPN